MSNPRVLFLMADYGHDPTETAVPFKTFKDAGFEIAFATEKGKSPDCDAKMLEGLTQKLLGATAAARKHYKIMKEDAAIKKPLSWTDKNFSLEEFDLLFFPGGHEKGVRQLLDSQELQKLLAEYFPKTLKPSKKSIAAICHGVLVLSEATYPDGRSLLHDVTTTTLPTTFEGTAYWGTKAFLGDYYKTYGAGSDSVETSIKKRLANPEKQFKSSLGLGAFVVHDEKYNYISGRFPADAELLATQAVAMVRECCQSAQLE